MDWKRAWIRVVPLEISGEIGTAIGHSLHDNRAAQQHSLSPVVDGVDDRNSGDGGVGGGRKEQGIAGISFGRKRERGRVWGERENRLEKHTFYTPAQYRADNSLSRPQLAR